MEATRELEEKCGKLETEIDLVRTEWEARLMEREEQFKLELQAIRCQQMGAVNFELEMAVKVSRDEIVELQREQTGLRDSLVAMKCHAEELRATQLQGI